MLAFDHVAFHVVIGTWGPNLPLFKARFYDGPGCKTYIDNLHFLFRFILRAILKAAPALRTMSFDTGSPEEDLATREMMIRLLDSPCLTTVCLEPLDERLDQEQEKDKPERQLVETQLQVSLDAGPDFIPV